MPKKNILEEGDLVKPGEKKNYYAAYGSVSSYISLDYHTVYIVTKTTQRKGYNLVELEPWEKSDRYDCYYEGCEKGLRYDSRNMVYLGSARENQEVNARPEWIVTDASGKVVATASASLTEDQEPITGAQLAEERVASLLKKNPDASYRLYQYVKTGKLPDVPVAWESEPTV